jgi:hypothetical protein
MSRLEHNSNRGGTEKGVHAARARSWRAAALSIVLMLAALLGANMLYPAGLAQGQPAPGEEQLTRRAHTTRRYWIGKNIREAEKEFGKPTFSEQLLETGGMLVIYASKKHPVHFVFETAPGGRIIKAARVE